MPKRKLLLKSGINLNKEESQNVEFKESWQDEYLKWICAFANTEGGSLFIGVDDKGNVCGVKDIHKKSEDIPNKIRNTMGIVCDVNLLTEGNLDYLEIKVEKYPMPISYKGKYYKRSGSTTQELSGVEVNKLILFSQGRTWDSIPVPGISAKRLDSDAIKLFKRRAIESHRLDEKSTKVSIQNLMQNLRCVEGDYLTRTAMMCFHPDPEKWVAGAYIKVAYFATEADLLFQDEIHGPLLIQVEKAMDLIFSKYMKALITYEGIHRQEFFFFPPDAFRELLLNAIVHKDYMDPTPIQIKIYADSIWMWNPGNMPQEVRVRDLFRKHVSKPRNPGIANIFFMSGYVERWGRGYYNIEQACAETNSKLPKVKASGGVTVECFASDKYKTVAKKWNVDGKSPELSPENLPVNLPVNPSLNKTQNELFALVVEYPSSTYDDFAGKMGKKRETIRVNLRTLEKLGLIKRVGADKNGHWEIVSEG